MPPKRNLKTKARWVWFLLTIAVWLPGFYWLRGADNTFYNVAGRVLLHWGGDEFAQLHEEGTEVAEEAYTVERHRVSYPAVGTVELDDQSVTDCYSATALPLRPHDTASMLPGLRRAGIHTIGVLTPRFWEDGDCQAMQDDICETFGTAFKEFPAAAMGLRVRSTKKAASAMPPVLEDSAIPAGNLQGDPSGLPSANGLAGKVNSRERSQILWAPDAADGLPKAGKSSIGSPSFPLLLRWEGKIIPTFPFRLALESLGLSPKDVKVHFGKEISFGGRTLPLDKQGRTPLVATRVAAIPLTEVADRKGPTLSALGKQERSCVILSEPVDGAPEQARLQLMAHTLAQLAGKDIAEESTCYRATGHVLEESPMQQSWWTLAWLLPLLALTLRFLPSAPTKMRRCVVFLVPVWAAYYTYSCLMEGMWFGVGAAALSWGVWALGVHYLKPAEQGMFRRRQRRR